MKYDEVIKNLDANKIKEIISQYVKHKPLINQNNYNIFSIINLRENNHTELVAWFLDKNHTFLKKFLTNEYLNINKLGILHLTTDKIIILIIIKESSIYFKFIKKEIKNPIKSIIIKF